MYMYTHIYFCVRVYIHNIDIYKVCVYIHMYRSVYVCTHTYFWVSVCVCITHIHLRILVSGGSEDCIY